VQHNNERASQNNNLREGAPPSFPLQTKTFRIFFAHLQCQRLAVNKKLKKTAKTRKHDDANPRHRTPVCKSFWVRSKTLYVQIGRKLI